VRAPADSRGFRDRLAAGERLVGTFITLPGAAFAELVAGAFDFVCVDLEHGALGAAELQDGAIGAQGAGAAALARVPAGSAMTAPALDCGIDGLVVPRVEDPSTARSVAAGMRLPDAGGSRGFGPRRSARRSPAEPALIAQIETAAGVERATAIARVDGVDALLLGTSDLAYDLGVALGPGAQLAACAASVRDAAHAAGCAFGIAGRLVPGGLGAEVERDASLVLLGTDAALCAAGLEGAAVAWRETETTPR
jgi:2-keto-3-deoxy-L-rhamnonate aldolase RhmA